MQDDESQKKSSVTPPPELTFPKEEATAIREYYNKASVILEYGSGGSTYLAASLPDKFVMSVESSRDWAEDIQNKIDLSNLPSPAFVYHVDIGQTGAWGRPGGKSKWANFYRYPTRIWAEAFFRDPDLILIDGRFRSSCFVASYLRITQPTTLLFDDYGDRPAYHVVEQLARPSAMHGRMARFDLEPGPRPIWVHDLFNELLSDITFSTKSQHKYEAKDRKGYPLNMRLSLK